jgi:hypothetical protein
MKACSHDSAPSSTTTTTKTKVELKLDGDSDQLLEALYHRFTWPISGIQVGIEWQQRRMSTNTCGTKDDISHIQASNLCHLGAPSPVNAQDCPLCLWVGVSRKTEELLVLLTQSMKLKKKSHKARRMFLVVPAESLALSTSVPGFQRLSLDQVPEQLFQRPTDKASAHSNGFLHINLALDSGRNSTVIMPAQAREKLAQGTALSLLDRLKSLSEASTFDMYFKFNTYAQQELLKLTEDTEHGCIRFNSYTTPVFNTKAMYSGDRNGVFDQWQAQGWQPDHRTETKSRKRGASDLLDAPPGYAPRRLAVDPPTYDDCVARTSFIEKQSSATAGADETSPQPPARLHVFVPRSCTPVDHIGRRLSQESAMSIVYDTPLGKTGKTDATSSKISAATPLNASPAIAPIAVSHLASPSNAVLPVIDISAGAPDTAPSTPGHSAPESTAALFVAASDTEVLNALPCTVAPLITGPNTKSPSIRLFEDMPDWLLRAWKISPFAHYICIVPLLALGYSARLEDVELYDNNRARCTDRFVSLVAKANAFVNTATMWPPLAILSCEFRNVISWMLMVNSSADSDLFDLLIDMKRELQSVIELSQIREQVACAADNHLDDEFDRRYARFLHSKALIIIQVCYRYGPAVWKHKADVALNMDEKVKVLVKLSL